MGKNKNIRYKMLRELESKIKLGTSKRSAKKENGGRSPSIHSGTTARTYMRQVGRYGDWLKDRGMGHCSMEEAREHVGEYLNEWREESPSAWTLDTARSAIAKVYGCSGDELCEKTWGNRHASDIVRGREMTPRALAAEKAAPDIAAFCRGSGLRSHRELERLTAEAVSKRENGSTWIHVQGKGGRWRDVEIFPEAAEILKDRIEKYGDSSPLFPDVPSHMNVHHYRADFACRAYDRALERGISNGKMYSPKDGSGRSFDRAALSYASQQLGHGNGRYETIVNNYLYNHS